MSIRDRGRVTRKDDQRLARRAVIKGRRMVTLNGKQIPLSVHVATAALGKPLPQGAIVHHMDGNPQNDKKSNLAILPDKAYHNLIHARLDAYLACGNPNWVRCYICKEYDDPANNMYIRPHTGHGKARKERRVFHRPCHSALQLKYYYRRTRNGG